MSTHPLAQPGLQSVWTSFHNPTSEPSTTAPAAVRGSRLPMVFFLRGSTVGTHEFREPMWDPLPGHSFLPGAGRHAHRRPRPLSCPAGAQILLTLRLGSASAPPAPGRPLPAAEPPRRGHPGAAGPGLALPAPREAAPRGDAALRGDRRCLRKRPGPLRDGSARRGPGPPPWAAARRL